MIAFNEANKTDLAALLEALQKSRSRIADPANWVVGMIACDERGQLISATSTNAQRWCAIGAVMATTGESDTILNELGMSCRRALSAEIKNLPKKWLLYSTPTVAGINDTMGHEAILELYDRTIATTKAKLKALEHHCP